MKNQEKSPIKILISELFGIYKRIENQFDWKKIDSHSSLKFLDRNYQMKPSDVARKLLYLLAIIVFYIEGFRSITILMCYLLPIGIMILKICEVMKSKKKKAQQTKQKLKQSELEQKSLEKNESVLSINSKQSEAKVESQSEQEVMNKNLNNQTQKSVLTKNNKGQNSQEVTVNQLCKLFICYFVVNLVIELSEPVLLLILHTAFSLGQVGVTSVQELIENGNYWVLVLLPFRFLSTFLVQIFSFSQANSPSKIVFVLFRVFLSAFLLNLNQQKNNYCTKFLFEQKFSYLSPQEKIDEKPKKE